MTHHKNQKNLINQKENTVQNSSSEKGIFSLAVKRMGIDTHNHLVCYMHHDCGVCRSEGFRSQTRIKLTIRDKCLIATLDVIYSPILKSQEIGLSECVWKKLEAQEGDNVDISQAEAIESFGFVRAKLYGKNLTYPAFKQIIQDMKSGMYTDVQLSSFITACVNLDLQETIHLTQTMSEAGRKLKWTAPQIFDKHCIGGLPGNRTSMLLVPILAAHGLIVPKTSSRAITSPAGTADTMEVLAPVNLSMASMKKVVEKEGGCIVWGGTVDLSPVDDVLVQVERVLDLDSSKQLVASVLSKKIAAGSTDILIDMPVGPTAKIRSQKEAKQLKNLFLKVGEAMGLNLHIVMTDGTQPIGRGIGPSLEARDILSVLKREKDAPQDLRHRSLFLAAQILSHFSTYSEKEAFVHVENILDSGQALKKFEAICDAQGGMRELKFALFTRVVIANRPGIISLIDNRHIARVAKLAGAPDSPVAGVDLHVKVNDHVETAQPLFTIHANSQGELDYAYHYYLHHLNIIEIGENH